jgi:hypothetical protein
VNDRRSSSLILCVEFEPAVPFTAIRPLLVSNLISVLRDGEVYDWEVVGEEKRDIGEKREGEGLGGTYTG